MAVYHVTPGGSDGNSGAPGSAWRTVNKVFGAGSPVAGGDVVIFGGGFHYREVNTMGFTSPTSEVRIIADYTGQYTGYAGDVWLSGFLTDDKTAPSTSPVLTFNQRRFLTFEDIDFIGGPSTLASCVQMAATTGGHTHQVKFKRCRFVAAGGGANRCVDLHCQFGVNSAVEFDDCYFHGYPGFNSGHVFLGVVSGAGADYDCGVIMRRCVSHGHFVRVGLDGGASSHFGGGVQILSSDVHGGTLLSVGASVATSIPCVAYNNKIVHGGPSAGLVANGSGQILEDYNLFWGTTPRTLVSAGSNSRSNSYAPLFELGGIEMRRGRVLRPFGEPMAGSPLLEYGDNGGAPATDALGRVSPYGGAALRANGALERAAAIARQSPSWPRRWP